MWKRVSSTNLKIRKMSTVQRARSDYGQFLLSTLARDRTHEFLPSSSSPFVPGTTCCKTSWVSTPYPPIYRVSFNVLIHVVSVVTCSMRFRLDPDINSPVLNCNPVSTRVVFDRSRMFYVARSLFTSVVRSSRFPPSDTERVPALSNSNGSVFTHFTMF